MLSLRHLLLALILCVAQWAAGAHALEHALGDPDGLAQHSCELCLAAHDLGGALPSVQLLDFQPPAPLRPEQLSHADRPAWPAPRATQRGPPLA